MPDRSVWVRIPNMAVLACGASHTPSAQSVKSSAATMPAESPIAQGWALNFSVLTSVR